MWLGHGPNDIFGGGMVNYKPGRAVDLDQHGAVSGSQRGRSRHSSSRSARTALSVVTCSCACSTAPGVARGGRVRDFLSVSIGIVMGLLAGFFRGWVDTVVSRLTEMVMVFPALLFIIAVRVTAGDTLNAITFGGLLVPGVFTLTLIFAVFGWFYPGRIVRGVVLSLREKEFVEAARMTGAGDWRIMRSHLLPHLVGPVIVYSTLIVAQTIIAEAGLSFLGLGIELPNASWGNLLQGAKDWYIQQPWLMVWPGLAILFTTLAFNMLGAAYVLLATYIAVPARPAPPLVRPRARGILISHDMQHGAEIGCLRDLYRLQHAVSIQEMEQARHTATG